MKTKNGVSYEDFEKCKSNFDMVLGLCRSGANVLQVCEHIGISVNTYYNWKATYPEFEKVTQQGREAADYAVENALYKRAVGFAYTERKIIKRNGEVVQEEIYYKSALPDSTSCAIWLNNRMSDKWKRDPDKVPGEDASTIEINVINSKEEMAKIRKKTSSDRVTKTRSEQKKALREIEENG